MFTLEDGSAAVRYARAVIERGLGRKDVRIPHRRDSFDVPSGVFVTLNTHPGKDLRGCIGYSEPVLPLGDAIEEVAIASATRDPRFPKVRLEEMGRICIDVTLLTPPERIPYKDVQELVSMVKIGRDGLIARKGQRSGLLLPQVPVEYGWGAEEFLSHTCMKAGLHPDEWRRGEVDFWRFSGSVFGEVEPGGDVEEVPLA